MTVPLRVSASFPDPRPLLLGQRRRMAAALAAIGTDDWFHATRCTGWDVHDVVAHLVTTDRFWAHSIRVGQNGEPSRLLASFNPNVTPGLLIEPMRDLDGSDVLVMFNEGVDRFEEAIASIEGDGWEHLAETPIGHVGPREAILHALWDGWIHERDILLPLGRSPVIDPDEVAAVLIYAAALSATIALLSGSAREGTFVVGATNPDVPFTVRVGSSVEILDATSETVPASLRGFVIELIEGISARVPLPDGIAADDLWLVNGVNLAFGAGSYLPEPRFAP